MAQVENYGRVEWSESLGEWIVIFGNIGYRHYFDCKAEADEYLRIRSTLGDSGKVWHTLGIWCVQHKHDFQCLPHWTRKENHADTN